MAKRTIFENDGKELTTFINHRNEIYIAAGEDLNDTYTVGCICLDLDDAIEFRNELNKLIDILS